MNGSLAPIVDAIGKILLGKQEQVKLALCCLLARGHLLIEDLPGMGKTTLAQCLARVLGLSYERVQFTSDLLPGDILGMSIFDRNSGEFKFHSGPIFTQVLLADEINRSTPKTQSALLEAMEERQVSLEGETRALPEPFFVIATQNPLSQAGTYPLPESQLDRFLLSISLGYPDAKSERELLRGMDPREMMQTLIPACNAADLLFWQKQALQIKVSEQLLDYVQRLVDLTRSHERFPVGLSPRAAMGLLRVAKAWTLLHNREHVLPDDIQAVLPALVEHRVLQGARVRDPADRDSLSAFLLDSVEVVVP